MTKTKLAAYATALMFAVTLSAQKYSITVETHIAGRPEDKFTFVLSEGESQYKGFDGKVLAKRYMAILLPLWIWRNTPILPRKPLKKLPK